MMIECRSSRRTIIVFGLASLLIIAILALTLRIDRLEEWAKSGSGSQWIAGVKQFAITMSF